MGIVDVIIAILIGIVAGMATVSVILVIGTLIFNASEKQYLKIVRPNTNTIKRKKND